MSIVAQAKYIGTLVTGVAIFLGIAAIGIGLVIGAASFSIWVLKWTFPAFALTILISIVVLAPLSLIPSTRGFSAIGFLVASFAFGAILWLWGMEYTYSVWGLIGVVIGLIFIGVGIVPIAMFAALVHGNWGNLGMFVLTAVVAFGCRGLAIWLAQKADERAARLNQLEITIRAREIID